MHHIQNRNEAITHRKAVGKSFRKLSRIYLIWVKDNHKELAYSRKHTENESFW